MANPCVPDSIGRLSLVFLLFCLVAWPAWAQVKPPPDPQTLPGSELFTNAAVAISIRMGGPEADSLAAHPRTFVRATVQSEGKTYEGVAVRIKGSVGSFRPLGDKPALTLDFGKFEAGRTFHGLDKIHLNNSVEDSGYMNELVGTEVFRGAGIPAPRVGHAVVTLNGRRLGLYVLKEGVGGSFLRAWFQRPEGAIYDSDWGRDVDERMKDHSVARSRERADRLRRVAAAALESDPKRVWDRLEECVDMERFLTFMAVEIAICHKDGYSMAKNNFRIYDDPGNGKAVFLPHGMDQLFGRFDTPWQPQMAGLVARAAMRAPEGPRKLKERLGALCAKEFDGERLAARVRAAVAGLRPSLTSREYADLRREAEALTERMRKRGRWLREELAKPEPTPLPFLDGIATPSGWRPVDGQTAAAIERLRDGERGECLHIQAMGQTSASWRATALLGRGKYRFEGMIRTEKVKPLAAGKNHGAALRVSGGKRSAGSFLGDAGWKAAGAEFEVSAEVEEVELVAELRASSGEAWFELGSLRLVKEL